MKHILFLYCFNDLFEEGRLSVLRFILSSRKTAAVLNSDQLVLVQRGIFLNLSLQRPLHRQLLNSILVKFFARLDASCELHGKDENVLKSYSAFIEYLIKLIQTQLIPGSSMQRNCQKLEYKIQFNLYEFHPEVLSSLFLAIINRLFWPFLRASTCLRLLLYLCSFNSKALTKMVHNSISKCAVQLHTALISGFFNSFSEINSYSFDVLVKLQGLDEDNSSRFFMIEKFEDTESLVKKLRSATTISAVTGYTLLVKYRHVDIYSVCMKNFTGWFVRRYLPYDLITFNSRLNARY